MKQLVLGILLLTGSIRAMDICEVPDLDIRFMMKFREVILCEFDNHEHCKEIQSAFQSYRDSLCSCPKTVVRRAICSTKPHEVLINSAIIAELKRTHDLDLWETDPSKLELTIEYLK